jgi:Sulfotransferase family
VPVFIIGMPRSGTSLVEQILASHPAIHGAGELPLFAGLAANRFGADGAGLSSESATPETLRAIGADYLAGVCAAAPAAARITEKTPANFRFAGLIHLALPGARLIHVRRDPVDTCWSCFARSFENDQNHTYELGELGRYYRAYADLMAHWRSVIPEDAMIEVQYEALVDDLEGQARRLVAHCGLEWDAACLAFHRTRRAVHTASAAQVRQPIYRGSVGHGRSYLALLQKLVDALGPELAGAAA